MPFYAIVEAISGEIIDVLPSLDEPPPKGAFAVELPGRWEDIPAHLREKLRNRGGGGGKETLLEREEQSASGDGGRRPDAGDAEQFFARLQVETIRAEQTGQHLSVVLLELAPQDRAGQGVEPLMDALAAAGQELLPCDFVARLRDHLAAALIVNIDARELRLEPERGAVATLVYPNDRDAIDALRRRKHPLLRPPSLRRSRAG